MTFLCVRARAGSVSWAPREKVCPQGMPSQSVRTDKNTVLNDMCFICIIALRQFREGWCVNFII